MSARILTFLSVILICWCLTPYVATGEHGAFPVSEESLVATYTTSVGDITVSSSEDRPTQVIFTQTASESENVHDFAVSAWFDGVGDIIIANDAVLSGAKAGLILAEYPVVDAPYTTTDTFFGMIDHTITVSPSDDGTVHVHNEFTVNDATRDDTAYVVFNLWTIGAVVKTVTEQQMNTAAATLSLITTGFTCMTAQVLGGDETGELTERIVWGRITPEDVELVFATAEEQGVAGLAALDAPGDVATAVGIVPGWSSICDAIEDSFPNWVQNESDISAESLTNLFRKNIHYKECAVGVLQDMDTEFTQYQQELWDGYNKFTESIEGEEGAMERMEAEKERLSAVIDSRFEEMKASLQDKVTEKCGEL
ncbi:hypothetical protein J8273_6148 [Carpediemonas membranifera]|uniref:Uncharacterized protein n=1 Tax=Carpediemonas membranifera TaxID=201153 RepID=A0A8J6DZY7_9EUKA|nr:hypothetical protein J8273_6148 [Carpediemonas membranifera]|eukprot:KAG9391388.1 hypothetical protein J8273_6148 [Carpediemonas membranifera]